MRPRLSVIVPIYDVEAYLPACLESLARQTLRDLEIVMVDDGSPDGSAAIADAYAQRDARFRLVRQQNAGLGAARNAGTAHAAPESEYVAFVDSDDVIPPDAFRMMVGLVDETGSDFVTGNVHHIQGRKTWPSPMHRILAGGAEKRTHVTRRRKLLTDRIACNKVFRRSFWDSGRFTFPEGVLYEDVPVILPAHVLARSVDVISEPTYYWRLREGEAAPSITQRRTEPRAVRDRVAAVQSVSRFLASRTDGAALKRAYDRTALEGDLRIFLNVLPQGDQEFRAEFFRVVLPYLDQVDPRVLAALPTALRLKWLLVRRGALDELLELMAAEQVSEALRVTGRLRRYAAFSGVDLRTLRLPRRALRIDGEMQLKAPVQELTWRDGRLHLLGHAWIDRVDQAHRRSAVKVLQVREAGTQRRFLLPLRNTHRPECTTYSGQKQHDYDWAGWEAVLDPARFRSGGRWREGTWHLGLGLTSGGLFRKGALQVSGPERPNHPPYQWLDERHRLLPTTDKGALRLRVEKVRALVTGYRAEGEHIILEGELREDVKPEETLRLRVTNRKSGERHHYRMTASRTAGRDLRFEARVPLHDVALMPHHQEDFEHADAEPGSAERARAARRTWSAEVVAVTADGAERRFPPVVADGLKDLQVRLPASFGERAERNEVAVVSGWNGYLKLCGRPAQAVLTDVTFTDGCFRLSGRTQATLHQPRLVIAARDQFEEKTVPLHLGPDGSFHASFRPATMSGANGTLPLKCGRWNFYLRAANTANDVPFVIDRLTVPAFPVEGEHRGRRYAFEARWHDFPQLNCLSDLSVMEHGTYRQNRLLEDVYRAGRREPLRDTVLYISYNGKQYSDSPRAIHEEMLRRSTDLTHQWVVRDSQVELPATVEPVRMWGTEWYEALARSRYIVTNAHLPHWLERREDQVVVQTWHGTMLKRIGLDIEAPAFDPDYHERLRAESQQWSLLVSANRFSTPILERALAFTGPILETGYPRNDHLYAADREVRAKETRLRLGLPTGKKVVLYAPTWRDDLSHRRGHFRFDLHLDLEAARRRLGEEYVLLIRRHANVVDSVPGAGDGFVWDVSEYPDIADLYLVADLLVTDYSSVMFDYAHLQRPMLFFTYDLEHYRDTLRGFYFDFSTDAPGPLLRTSDEVIDAIGNIDRVAAAYDARYRRFHHLFCGLDDGNASQRVVDHILERG